MVRDDRVGMDSFTRLIAPLGNIVTVWAHPDDESYLAAGVMAIARSTGARVTCVVATDGDFAESTSARAAAGRERLAELSRALGVLGVDDVELLHLPDGGCADLDPTGPTAAIAAVLVRGPRGPIRRSAGRARIRRWPQCADRTAGRRW